MTITAAPPVSNDASTYLLAVWWEQPHGAAATDAAYLEWEEAWDQLCTDAEHGIPAALEAVDLIDADVEAAIHLHRGTTGRGEDPRRPPAVSMSSAGGGDGLEAS